MKQWSLSRTVTAYHQNPPLTQTLFSWRGRRSKSTALAELQQRVLVFGRIPPSHPHNHYLAITQLPEVSIWWRFLISDRSVLWESRTLWSLYCRHVDCRRTTNPPLVIHHYCQTEMPEWCSAWLDWLLVSATHVSSKLIDLRIIQIIFYLW